MTRRTHVDADLCSRPGCLHSVLGHVPDGCLLADCSCAAFLAPARDELAHLQAQLDGDDDGDVDVATQVAGVVSQLGEWLEPVLEAVEGYRGKLQSIGYPADAAASMAADYHRLLLAAFTSDKRAEAEGR